jgi:hypothetical protein
VLLKPRGPRAPRGSSARASSPPTDAAPTPKNP